MSDSVGARLRPMSEAKSGAHNREPGSQVRVVRGRPESRRVTPQWGPGAASGPATTNPAEPAGTTGRGGHPGGVAQPLMAGRHVRGFRAQHQYGGKEASGRAGRLGGKSPVHRDRGSTRVSFSGAGGWLAPGSGCRRSSEQAGTCDATLVGVRCDGRRLGRSAPWSAGTQLHSSGSSTTIHERRLTANAAELPVLDGVISPDGKYLAFTDATGFHLRQVDSGETHTIALPAGFHARPRSWFPDGTHLLATSIAGPQELESIWEIPLLGGSPRKLVEGDTYPAVSPDGAQVAYLAAATQFKEASLNREIWVMNAEGEQPRKVIGGGNDVLGPPAWSPDGKSLAYMRGKISAGMPWIRRQLEILNLSTGQTNVLMAAPELGVNDRLGTGRALDLLPE